VASARDVMASLSDAEKVEATAFAKDAWTRWAAFWDGILVAIAAPRR
jgi:hypothetical protein